MLVFFSIGTTRVCQRWFMNCWTRMHTRTASFAWREKERQRNRDGARWKVSLLFSLFPDFHIVVYEYIDLVYAIHMCSWAALFSYNFYIAFFCLICSIIRCVWTLTQRISCRRSALLHVHHYSLPDVHSLYVYIYLHMDWNMSVFYPPAHLTNRPGLIMIPISRVNHDNRLYFLLSLVENTFSSLHSR